MQQGGKKQRGQAKERAAGELKSLVSSPLHWLPKDQQGAKSTRGRRKWMGFRDGGIQSDGEMKKESIK